MTPLETLDRIQELVAMPLGRYLEQRQRLENGLGLNLHQNTAPDSLYFNLSKTNLEGVDLSSAILVGVDFEEANLKNANLQRARCALSDFTDANLEGANLRSADLSRTSLWDTILKGADLRGTDFQGADAKIADFTGARRLPKDAPLHGWKLVRGVLVKK